MPRAKGSIPSLSAISRASPPCIPRNSGKKGARSGGGRRMSAGAHPWWGRISTRGATQGYICRWSYFHHQSLSWLTSALRCVLYVRIGPVSPRHHFIPLMAPTIALLPAARLYEFSRLSHESDFFSDQCSPREPSSLLHFSLSNASVRAYPNVAPITRTNDSTKVPNFRARCSGIERGPNAVC